jgi:hypothetical protein
VHLAEGVGKSSSFASSIGDSGAQAQCGALAATSILTSLDLRFGGGGGGGGGEKQTVSPPSVHGKCLNPK